MDLSSIRRRLNYTVYAVVMFASFCWVHIFVEAERFTGSVHIAFVYGKAIFGVLGFVIAYLLFRSPDRDRYKAALFAMLAIYCVYFLWLAPLYEVAYLQAAIGCAFMRTKNPRLFIYFFTAGLLGIFVSYYFQDQMKWKVPPASQVDWIFTIVIFFILGWLIQRFAVRSFRMEEDRLSRLGLIGSEAAKLLREVDARLEKPLALAKFSRASIDDGTVKRIQEELKVAQTTLRRFRAEASSTPELQSVDVADLIRDAADRLEFRLRETALELPDSRTYLTDADTLRSIFFNLMLNSAEAAEKQGLKVRRLTWTWSGPFLIYADGNERVSESSAAEDRGLGLPIIRQDCRRLNIEFTERIVDGRGQSVLDFKRVIRAQSALV